MTTVHEEESDSEEIRYIGDPAENTPANAPSVHLATSTASTSGCVQQRRSCVVPAHEEIFRAAESPPKIYYHQEKPGLDVRWCTRCESWQCMACAMASSCLVGCIGLSLSILLILDS